MLHVLRPDAQSAARWEAQRAELRGDRRVESGMCAPENFRQLREADIGANPPS
jgi:hypothetical protein